jgi:ATP-dependent DNA ligase
VSDRPDSLCQELAVWDGVTMPEGGAFVEEKHDGWRLLHINGKCFTRRGMPYRGIAHIERALDLLQRQYDAPMFFDGEYVVGTGLHTLAQTKAHQDRLWRTGDDGVLHVFDAVPMSQWEVDECRLTLSARKVLLLDAIEGMKADPLSWECGWQDGVECPVKFVDHQFAHDAYDVESMAREVWARQGEGVVIKDPYSPYRRNRNTDWQKHRRDIEKRSA